MRLLHVKGLWGPYDVMLGTESGVAPPYPLPWYLSSNSTSRLTSDVGFPTAVPKPLSSMRTHGRKMKWSFEDEKECLWIHGSIHSSCPLVSCDVWKEFSEVLLCFPWLAHGCKWAQLNSSLKTLEYADQQKWSGGHVCQRGWDRGVVADWRTKLEQCFYFWKPLCLLLLLDFHQRCGGAGWKWHQAKAAPQEVHLTYCYHHNPNHEKCCVHQITLTSHIRYVTARCWWAKMHSWVSENLCWMIKKLLSLKPGAPSSRPSPV